MSSGQPPAHSATHLVKVLQAHAERICDIAGRDPLPVEALEDESREGSAKCRHRYAMRRYETVLIGLALLRVALAKVLPTLLVAPLRRQAEVSCSSARSL